MKHLDFTIDFETCSMSANAAVMQVAIVPWLRDNDCDPFCSEEGVPCPYVGYVDLRTCVVDGFDFDPATVKWWSERSYAAKKAVTADLPKPVSDVLITTLDYIRDIKKRHDVDSMCLWCQGPDVDIAILRNLCRKYDVNLEDIIPHTCFRDCRTVILEAAYKLACQQRLDAIATAETLLQDGTPVPSPAVSPQEVLAGSRKAYDLFPPLPSRYDGCLHDANYDALRSTWYTWQALRVLRN